MQFLLTGFSEDVGFRVFAFDGLDAERKRSAFSVRVDIALIRKHGIHIQDLPLLCRGLLELRKDEEDLHALIYTEEDMRLHAVRSAAEKEATHRKRTPRRQPGAGAASGSPLQPDQEVNDIP